MKYILLLIVISLFGNFNIYGQHKIEGIVYFKGTNDVREGVCVVEKSTKNYTLTDKEGKFELDVSNDTAILVLSYVGMATTEIEVNKEYFLEIYMHYSHADYFFDILSYISYSGGVRHNQFGGELDLFYFLFSSPTRLLIEYQTNFGSNYNFATHIKHIKLFEYNDYSSDLIIGYNKKYIKALNFKKENFLFNLKHQLLIGNFNFDLISGIGYTNVEFDSIKTKDFSFSIGIAKRFKRRLYPYFYNTFFNKYWQYEIGLKWEWRKFCFNLSYEKLSKYSEINIKLGYSFYSGKRLKYKSGRY